MYEKSQEVTASGLARFHAQSASAMQISGHTYLCQMLQCLYDDNLLDFAIDFHTSQVHRQRKTLNVHLRHSERSLHVLIVDAGCCITSHRLQMCLKRPVRRDAAAKCLNVWCMQIIITPP